MPSQSWTLMAKLVNQIYSKPDAEPFREAVDWKSLGLYDYPQIVKKPMDLGQIKRKIEKEEYPTLHACGDDVRLVWENCKTYNADGSDFYLLAESMSKKFEDKFAKLLKELNIPDKADGGDVPEPTLEEKKLFAKRLYKITKEDLGKVIIDLDTICPAVDAVLGAPRCASATSSCESGDLLKRMSCSEPNGSNSVDECVDGSKAIQSIERITAASLSGEVFKEGDMVVISADVHAWLDGQSDVAVDIYHAVSASYPIWNLVHSEVVNGGMATVSANHELPGGSPTQAFRFNIRHGGQPETGCSGGQWDDVDDLILHVEPEVITTTTTTTPPRTQNPNCPNKSGSGWGSCGPDKPCADGACCSQWGYCGLSNDFCGTCCQNGPCFS